MTVLKLHSVTRYMNVHKEGVTGTWEGLLPLVLRLLQWNMTDGWRYYKKQQEYMWQIMWFCWGGKNIFQSHQNPLKCLDAVQCVKTLQCVSYRERRHRGSGPADERRSSAWSGEVKVKWISTVFKEEVWIPGAVGRRSHREAAQTHRWAGPLVISFNSYHDWESAAYYQSVCFSRLAVHFHFSFFHTFVSECLSSSHLFCFSAWLQNLRQTRMYENN